MRDGQDSPDAGYELLRVVRGGAWNNPRDFARCAFQARYDPDDRYFCLGFRVVLSPV